MPSAGQLRERVRFQRRAPDENGEAMGPWVDVFGDPIAAEILLTGGGEEVRSQRLQGLSPAKITVRGCIAIREATNAWRIVDARDGTLFDIKSVGHDVRRAWFVFTVEAGAADGGEVTEADR